MTVYDLEQVELCYAPQYGHAKAPINMAGFVASGVIRGDHSIIHVDEMHAGDDFQVVDVRTPSEYAEGHLAGSVNIPPESLRKRMTELSHQRP